jgi:hypothetical protein
MSVYSVHFKSLRIMCVHMSVSFKERGKLSHEILITFIFNNCAFVCVSVSFRERGKLMKYITFIFL